MECTTIGRLRLRPHRWGRRALSGSLTIPSGMVAFVMTTTMPLRMSLSSRPLWRDRSRTRRSLRDSLVFIVLELIQLGLHVGQCPKDLPP